MWAFLEWTQPHHVLAATIRAAEILALLLDEEDLARVDIDMHREELAALLPLLGRERFDRRKLNRCPGNAGRDRDEGGMKITVQVVLQCRR